MKTPDYPIVLREQIRRHGFRAFVGPFWDTIESITFRPNWHADCIADHLQAVHDHEINRLVICMPPRLGKDIACDTEILTANRGWTTAGDVRVGDLLFGSDGQPTEVLEVFPQGPMQQYRVAFSDGTSLEAGSGHSWEVWTHGGGTNRKLNPGRLNRFGSCRDVKTTEQLLVSGVIASDGRKKYEIPTLMAPIDLPAQDLPMDPYILGLWLGDGAAAGNQITSMDPEIVAAVDAQYPRGKVCNTRHHGKATTYSWLGGFGPTLRRLGLINNKHIPCEYLHGSASQRLALLQGLIDTDGGVGKDGVVSFDNTNERIVDGVSWLVRSLGGVVKVTRRDCHLRQYPNAKISYRLNIHLPEGIPPCRLTRKLERVQYFGNTSRPRRKIVAIEPSRITESVCYRVAASDHLFCAGRELIVTHNSLYTSVLFPAYVWSQRPLEYIFNASYDLRLVEDFARKSNDVINSELFRRTFPKGATLPQKKFAISEYANLQGGKRYSTIIGGRSTGMGAQVQIIDDPAKASAANAEDPKILQNAIANIDGALSTRTYGDPDDFRRILVMQRLHQKDPAGHLIKDLGWEALILPMEYSKAAMWDCMSSLQFRDPRAEDGELLFPNLWGQEAVDRLKKELSGANGGSVKFVSAQLNQDPKVDGGSMVDRDWFGLCDEDDLPWIRDRRKPQLVFSCTDPGSKGTMTSHSRTAMGHYAIYNNRLYMLDRQMGHLRYPEFKDEFVRLHSDPWKDVRRMVVEDKANGTPLLADLGYNPDPEAKVDPKFVFASKLVAVDPGNESKVERFRPHTDLIRRGKVTLVRAPWNESFLNEVCEFPGGDKDDQVDITTMACQVLVDTTRTGTWASRALSF